MARDVASDAGWQGSGPGGPGWGDGGPPTRTDWAERLLRSEILMGRLPPGEHLKVGHLVDRYNLSPTPVREALGRLAGSGFVEVLPRRGARVVPATRAELLDLYENRLRLESAALERSVVRGDAAWDAELRAARADLAEVSRRAGDATPAAPAAAGDASPAGGQELAGPAAEQLMEWERVHRRFHFALLSRCDSPWLLRLIGTLYDNSMRYRWLTLGRDGVRSVASAFQRHDALLEAAFARDVPRALDELHHHMQLTIDSVDEVDLP